MDLWKEQNVYFLDIRKKENGIKEKGISEKLNQEIEKIIKLLLPEANGAKNALLKTHVGEYQSDTYMRAELLEGSIAYLKNIGIETVVYGDTTVAYSGTRSFKDNPENNPSKYMKLAEDHGFTKFCPFVILDRPVTATGSFQFSEIHIEKLVEQEQIRYKKIYPSGGFLAADLILNNAHLTGHYIAKNALCSKSIAMGLGSYEAKIQLHQSLYPEIEQNKCILCNQCVENCPVNALNQNNKQINLEKRKCIGCGQCAVICPEKAITMQDEGLITDWSKGNDSLDFRIAEYTIALLKNFGGKLINLAHLYTITEVCDCMDIPQSPSCKDIGILLGINPFAVDFASVALQDLLNRGDNESYTNESLQKVAGSSRYKVYQYVKENFGIEYLPEIKRIEI